MYLGIYTGGSQKSKKELREKTAGIGATVLKYASVQNDAKLHTGKNIPKIKSIPQATKPPKIQKMDTLKSPIKDNPNFNGGGGDFDKMAEEVAFGTMDKRRAEKIINAAGSKQMVDIKYKDSKGNITTRTVEPYKLDQNEFWAYDPDKDSIRHFKLKNVKSLKPSKNTYDPRWDIDMNKIAREHVKERALEKLAFMSKEERERAKAARNWSVPKDMQRMTDVQNSFLKNIDRVEMGSNPQIDNLKANIALAGKYYGVDPAEGRKHSEGLSKARRAEYKAGKLGGGIGALAAVPALALGSKAIGKIPSPLFMAGLGATAIGMPIAGTIAGRRSQLSKYKDVDTEKLESDMSRMMIAVNDGVALSKKHNILDGNSGIKKNLQIEPDENGRLNYKMASIKHRALEKLATDRNNTPPK